MMTLPLYSALIQVHGEEQALIVPREGSFDAAQALR